MEKVLYLIIFILSLGLLLVLPFSLSIILILCISLALLLINSKRKLNVKQNKLKARSNNELKSSLNKKIEVIIEPSFEDHSRDIYQTLDYIEALGMGIWNVEFQKAGSFFEGCINELELLRLDFISSLLELHPDHELVKRYERKYKKAKKAKSQSLFLDDLLKFKNSQPVSERGHHIFHPNIRFIGLYQDLEFDLGIKEYFTSDEILSSRIAYFKEFSDQVMELNKHLQEYAEGNLNFELETILNNNTMMISEISYGINIFIENFIEVLSQLSTNSLIRQKYSFTPTELREDIPENENEIKFTDSDPFEDWL